MLLVDVPGCDCYREISDKLTRPNPAVRFYAKAARVFDSSSLVKGYGPPELVASGQSPFAGLVGAGPLMVGRGQEPEAHRLLGHVMGYSTTKRKRLAADVLRSWGHALAEGDSATIDRLIVLAHVLHQVDTADDISMIG